MSYTSPHHLRDYLKCACLAINHAYCIRCQRRSESDRRSILAETREIDLCADLSHFFNPSCHLAAQGTSDPDLKNDAPVFRAEVKYIHPHKTNWTQVREDWDWLLRCSNNGSEFDKRAVILFWPSTSLHRFTGCLSVTKSHGNQYSLLDFAPFTPYAEPEMPVHGVNQRLRFKVPAHQTGNALQLPGGKRVQVDIIGFQTHPIWAAIYTRLRPDEFNATDQARRIEITDDPIVI